MNNLKCKVPPSTEQPDFSVAKFIRFLKHLKLRQLLKRINDPRDPQKTKYKIEVIISWALSVFFFRKESVNSFYAALEKLHPHQRKSIWYYLGCPEGSPLPHRTVITDCLALLNPEEINDLLMTLFKWAYKQKIFYHHSGKLLPGDMFHIAMDGVWLHHHTCPHKKDAEGKNTCPYCLPRVHDRGTEEENTTWLHACVNFCILCPGGLQLPLYVHMLNCKQVQGKESASQENHKQECELQAARAVLPLLKKQMPRLPIRILTDSLYANAPFLNLGKKLRWEWLITRQEGALKRVEKQCDEREVNTHHKKHYIKKRTIKLKDGGRIEQSLQYFNSIYVDTELIVHVIRFEEIHYDAKGEVLKRPDGKDRRFKTEWLSSTLVTDRNCFDLMEIARMRASQEDLHNTLKNRGFAAEHEYARSNPTAWLMWTLLMFVAFWIFELFSFTRAAIEGKGRFQSWHDFARQLYAELSQVPIEKLLLDPFLQKERLQFRFEFS